MKIPDILKDKRAQSVAISVVAFAVGSGLGYILGKRKGKNNTTYITKTVNDATIFVDELKRRRLAENQIEDGMPVVSNLGHDRIDIQEEDESNLPADERVDRILERQKVREERAKTRKEQAKTRKEQEEPEPVHVFVNPDGDWDYEAELTTRDSQGPYVIHIDEFMADEMDYHRDTLTYYSGDDIMADSDDTPIYNYAGLMGELKFGHGSKDPNVVYIRNEKIHMEWEILLHEGMFSEEVLGLAMENDAETEIHHERSVLKFRPE